MKEEDLMNFKGLLEKEERWTVVGHSIPDGDCVGAVTALYLVLANLGKKVTAVIEDGVPETYSFLVGAERIRSWLDLPEIHPAVVYVDCSDQERVGDRVEPHLRNRKITVNIDHHISNLFFGDLNLVDCESSSASELVYDILKQLDIPVDKDVASALYCGIVMDTGSFQYSSTRPKTHRLAAELMEKGIDTELIRTSLFESKSRTEMEVLRAALSTLTYSQDGLMAWMHLKYEDLKRMGAEDLHFEGIINFARNVKGVELAILFREISPGKVKVGFRSRNQLDVNQLAAIWGGGGHSRAAGALLNGELDKVMQTVIEVCRGRLT